MSTVQGDRWALINGDCLAVLAKFRDNRFDSTVTDPPYELGFMAKEWDGTGIAYRVELWREILRVLKPGGHLLSFGGTRTYHRMTCAIEDAGFEIRDSLHWFYGTGFPKSKNLGEGRGTALKPGHEPIVLARKPLIGTVAANVAEWKTGAINVDACRLGRDEIDPSRDGEQPRTNGVTSLRPEAGPRGGDLKGRWPANVLLDAHAAAELDAQSGTLTSGSWNGKRNEPKTKGIFGEFAIADEAGHAGDSGGASRFFYVAKPGGKERDLGCADLPAKTGGEATDREDGSAGVANPRAGAGRGGGRRNYHPTVKPIELMRYLCRLITPPGGTVLDPFAGSGTTGIAALREGFGFVGIEREAEYVPIAEARIRAA